MAINKKLSQRERNELEQLVGVELSKVAEEMDIQRLREWIWMLDGALSTREKNTLKQL